MARRYGPWTQLRSKIAYRNPWIRIQEDQVIRPDGRRSMYAFLQKPPGIFTVAFDGRGVFLLRQYRYAIRRTILELPGGVMQGQRPLQNAKREFFEETGIRARTWKRIGHYFTAPGHEQTEIYTYLATNLDTRAMSMTRQEGDESIQGIIHVSLPKLRRMLQQNRVHCGISVAALGLFFNHLALTKQRP